jgi:hypothetical protein
MLIRSGERSGIQPAPGSPTRLNLHPGSVLVHRLVPDSSPKWPPNRSTPSETVRILVFVWIVLVAAAAVGGFQAMAPSRRVGAWSWIAVCAVLLIAFAASFVMLGASAEKTLFSMVIYFLNWSMAAGGAAVCIGVIAGLGLALAIKR